MGQAGRQSTAIAAGRVIAGVERPWPAGDAVLSRRWIRRELIGRERITRGELHAAIRSTLQRQELVRLAPRTPRRRSAPLTGAIAR